MGSNEDGQLGRGDAKDCTVPKQISPDKFNGKKILSVSCGMTHTLLIDETSTVWGFGSNEHQQILPVGYVYDSPTVIPFPDLDGRIMSTDCGDNTSYAVSSEGLVYAWGSNDYGQAGQSPKVNTDIFHPTPLTVDGRMGGEPLTGAVSVSGGMQMALILMDTGVIMGLGRNGSFQLGMGDPKPTTYENAPVTVMPSWGTRTPVSISAGQMHSLALMDDGSVYCWGENMVSQCGTSRHKAVPTPMAVDLRDLVGNKATIVSAGNQFSMAVDTQGEVYGMGANTGGNLGLGNNNSASHFTRSLSGEMRDIVLGLTTRDNTYVITGYNTTQTEELWDRRF
ncbi:hypothetical protein KIPB_008605 [Kipferlia bialata]|uniref:RCC1-like domain-containing protein n=1 Tax=Kipferlia bialata TaxID=797122 RepID=A0A9K3D3M2_9EUKA|nr:hypothetical protein KIPB_008605 [Kipferlia bialata]|eukprot:g8605.t1